MAFDTLGSRTMLDSAWNDGRGLSITPVLIGTLERPHCIPKVGRDRRNNGGNKMKYLLILREDIYIAKIVDGTNLLKAVEDGLYDGVGEMPQEEAEFWHERLSNDNNWSHSPDHQRTTFTCDIGESAHLSLHLITEGGTTEEGK
jgi:hypothetical protein